MDLLDAQPEFTKSPWDYLDLLVSDDRIARGRELLAQYAADLRRGRARLRRRPPHRRGDLGRRIELRHAGRRPAGDPLDRDAWPASAAAAIISARNSCRRWKSCSAATSRPIVCRLVGRRFRADAIHADVVQALCGRFRRRRPARRRRFDAGRDRLDRQQSENGRLGDAARAGATKSCCRRTFNYLLADRSRQMTVRQWQSLGVRRAGRQAVSAPGRPRLSAAAGRRARAGLPDAARISASS